MGKLNNPINAVALEKDVAEYKKILEKLYGGKVCLHCILTQLFSFSVALIYDSLDEETSEKMSSRWDTVEAQCGKNATHFLKHADII